MFTTLASVKEYLGITGNDDDALLTTLVGQTTEWMKTMMGGRNLAEATYTEEEYDGGDLNVTLDNWPLTETTPLVAEYRSGTFETPVWKPYSANDFLKYPKQGYVHFPGATPLGPRNLRFTYSAGYATIPLDIAMLANQLVGHVFNTRKSEGIKKMQVEGSSIEYESTSQTLTTVLSDQQQTILDRYTRLM